MDMIATFIKAAQEDIRIGPTHISLYVALVLQCYWNNLQNPVCTSCGKIMPLARIHSRYTYYRCLNELSRYGYIKYIPSYDPCLESIVYLLEIKQGVKV